MLSGIAQSLPQRGRTSKLSGAPRGHESPATRISLNFSANFRHVDTRPLERLVGRAVIVDGKLVGNEPTRQGKSTAIEKSQQVATQGNEKGKFGERAGRCFNANGSFAPPCEHGGNVHENSPVTIRPLPCCAQDIAPLPGKGWSICK